MPPPTLIDAGGAFLVPAPRDDRARIVVADDHPLVRMGLRYVLDAQPHLYVVAEAGDVEEALRLTRAHRPDVLVLDLSMPGRDSLAALPELLQTSPGTRLVTLAMQDDPALALAALRSGASGYVVKDAAGDELVDAVHQALRNQTYLHPQLSARIALRD